MDHGTEATYKMIERLRDFINAGDVNASMSLEERWEGRRHRHCGTGEPAVQQNVPEFGGPWTTAPEKP